MLGDFPTTSKMKYSDLPPAQGRRDNRHRAVHQIIARPLVCIGKSLSLIRPALAARPSTSRATIRPAAQGIPRSSLQPPIHDLKSASRACAARFWNGNTPYHIHFLLRATIEATAIATVPGGDWWAIWRGPCTARIVQVPVGNATTGMLMLGLRFNGQEQSCIQHRG